MEPQKASFLSDSNSDAAVLRKRIAELELENKQLKNTSGGSGVAAMGQTKTGDRDWLNFGASNKGPLERPTTASGSNQRVRELEN